MRYYYKCGNNYLSLKNEVNNAEYIPITEAEFNSATHTEPCNTAKIDEIERLCKTMQLKQELSKYDYIGIKIATGVATKEEYAEKIAYMETLRQQIRELENE